QLLGNLLGGAMSQWVGLGNVFYVSALSLACGFVLILFTKKSRKTVQTV
ncbi:MFS transporter, partial [Staphylococcus pseudintermedius]